MAIIHIKDLRLRTIIGANDWERDHKQDLIINVKIEFDATKSAISDDLDDTVDYKKISKNIIKEVESSSFFLLEKLGSVVLEIVMQDPRIQFASVKIDKPFALRFADSVSIELSKQRSS